MFEVVAIACAAVTLGLFALGGVTVYMLRDTLRAPAPEPDELSTMVPVEFRDHAHYVETIDGRYRHHKDKSNDWLRCELGEDQVLRSEVVVEEELKRALSESYRRWALGQSRGVANRALLHANQLGAAQLQGRLDELMRGRPEHPAMVDAAASAMRSLAEEIARPLPPPLPGDEFRSVGGGWFESADGRYRTRHGHYWFATANGSQVSDDKIDGPLASAFERWKTLREWKGK